MDKHLDPKHMAESGYKAEGHSSTPVRRPMQYVTQSTQGETYPASLCAPRDTLDGALKDAGTLADVGHKRIRVFALVELDIREIKRQTKFMLTDKGKDKMDGITS